MFNASPRLSTPSCLPSTPITRTSRARIFPFTLTNGPEEEEEREGKGRLKTPSSVETYSCIDCSTITIATLDNLIVRISQANNCTGFCNNHVVLRDRQVGILLVQFARCILRAS